MTNTTNEKVERFNPPTAMSHDDNGNFVHLSAYQSLTAERDSLKALCVELIEALAYVNNNHVRNSPATIRSNSALLTRARSVLK